MAVFCFGPLRIFYAQEPLVLKSKKAEELLTYLVCEKGNLISKKCIAETIWPGRTESQAMYCLYKTLEWFKNLRRKGVYIPLVSQRGTLGLDTSQIYSDLWEFEKFYYNRSEIENCQKAIDLYIGPLLIGAPYNWISAHEARYELSCAELLQILVQQCEETSQLNIYQKKLKLITEP